MEPKFELRSCSLPWIRIDLTKLHESRFQSVLFTESSAAVKPIMNIHKHLENEFRKLLSQSTHTFWPTGMNFLKTLC